MDGDNLSDSVSNSVSQFSQHLVLIEEQLVSDPLNGSLLSLRNDILNFLQIARAQSCAVIDPNPLHTTATPLTAPQLVIGDKCSIPYSSYTGEVTNKNCVVMELDQLDSSAVVLFTHPTDISMVPCQHFLEGNCRFGDECRYSHGHRIDIRLVGAYEESDLSQARQDSSCFVYREDEKIWIPAVISQAHEDSCEVWVDRLNENIDVQIKDIFISKVSDNINIDYSSEESDVEIRTIPSLPSRGEEGAGSGVCSETEVAWERHTRGIGSKLLSKMGYVPGAGLGARGHGRRDPVEIVVLPKGRGLDKCMELRNSVKSTNNCTQKRGISSRVRKHALKNRAVRSDDSINLDVFEFLNESVQLQRLVHDELRESGGVGSVKKRVDTSQSRQICLDKELRNARGEVHTLRSSLSRNRKDLVVARQIEIKLETAERELSRLEREEGRIVDKLTTKKQRANMSVF